MAKQAVKKGAGIASAVKKFDVKDFKNKYFGNESKAKSADKEMMWITMPEAFQDALRLPGIPLFQPVSIRGWEETGKSTIKNCAIAGAMRQNILPVIFETEGNFDFRYARDCGMPIEPVYENVKYTDEETGEVYEKREIVDWEGNYILFTNRKICEFCGNMDYTTGKPTSKYRDVPVIEDIAYIISDLLDRQRDGEIPMDMFFVWDSIGSIQSYRSLTSKVGNNQWDAGAISVSFKPIFARISGTKELGVKYNNGMLVINKIWQDNQNSVGPAVAIANAGGKTFSYGIRLGIHCGGLAKSATKKLKATYKGIECQYGTLTKVSIWKNELPTPFNITYSGSMCCVHNGLESEERLDEYKKKYLPEIIKRANNAVSADNIDINDVTFSEEEQA